MLWNIVLDQFGIGRYILELNMQAVCRDIATIEMSSQLSHSNTYKNYASVRMSRLNHCKTKVYIMIILFYQKWVFYYE